MDDLHDIPERKPAWGHYEAVPWHDAPDAEADNALEAWDEAITTAETLIANMRRHFTTANAEFACAGSMSHARMHEIRRAAEALDNILRDLEDAVSMSEALS